MLLAGHTACTDRVAVPSTSSTPSTTSPLWLPRRQLLSHCCSHALLLLLHRLLHHPLQAWFILVLVLQLLRSHHFSSHHFGSYHFDCGALNAGGSRRARQLRNLPTRAVWAHRPPRG